MLSGGRIALLIAIPTLLAAKAPPSQGSPAIDSVTACRTIADNGQRLACFDKAAAALDTAVTQHDITVLDRQEVTTTRRSLFGFSLPNLALFGVGSKGDDEKKEEFSSLDSTIVSVRSVSYQKWDMTIAEGNAVWRNIDLIEKPSTGSKVHITKGALGSYFFKIDSDRAIKASRVQ